MNVRIGCATAWSGDRFEPATVLVERGELDYLFFETMSETTMSGAQVKRAEDPGMVGYDPYLDLRLGPILAKCHEQSVKIVSNQGWLDPVGAARRVAAHARALGITGMKVAALVPTPLDGALLETDLRFEETGEQIAGRASDVVSAEAYLGAWEIVEALRNGADVVLTSRVTDASLVLGPLIHTFGWARDDWDRLARGVVIGHLLECSTQVTGGNFADPGFNDVPGLEDLGHPIAEVGAETAVITKVEGTGGVVSSATCKSQLLYEVGDPSRYINPDVIADFSSVWFEEIAPDRVAVHGGSGQPPPETLKVLVGVRDGYVAEEVMLYAGPGALDRARLAEQVLRSRLAQLDTKVDDLRFDYIGINAVHREASPSPVIEPYEVGLRVAAKSRDRSEIEKIATAVAPMAVSGPAGTGKWGTLGNRVRPVVGMNSVLIPRTSVDVNIEYFEA